MTASTQRSPLTVWAVIAAGYAISAGLYFGDVFDAILSAFLGAALGAGAGVIAGVVAGEELRPASGDSDFPFAGVIGGMILGIAVGVPLGVGSTANTIVASGAVGLVLAAFQAARTMRDVQKWRKEKDDRISRLAAEMDANSARDGADD